MPTTHQLGVRHLAMEAWYASVVKEANRTRHLPADAWGYLEQSERRAFIQMALDLGWSLIVYEADVEQEPPGLSYRQRNNRCEEQQAHHLSGALAALPAEGKLLVCCGKKHHAKALVLVRAGEPDKFWTPMGSIFVRMKSGVDPFVIDQGVAVQWLSLHQWLQQLNIQL